MSVSDSDIAAALELFEGLGDITFRKMMGGASIYCDGQIFSILDAESQLYLKAKGAFADILEAEGCDKFTTDDGRTMGYWTMPDAGLDDPQLACDWARRALDAL